MPLVLLACLALEAHSPALAAAFDERADTVAHSADLADLRASIALPRPDLAQDSVWAVVLDSLFTRTGQLMLLISDSTSAPPRFGPGDTTGLQVFGRLVAELDPALLADFRLQNARPGAVHVASLRALGLRVPAAGLSRAERDSTEVSQANGLYTSRSHPGSDAVISLSRVGFSPDRTQALVHVLSGCGPRCGGTQLVLLRRELGGRWKLSRAEEGITF